MYELQRRLPRLSIRSDSGVRHEASGTLGTRENRRAKSVWRLKASRFAFASPVSAALP